MVLVKEKKSEIVSDYQLHDKDTGSPEVQVAILTERIQYLTGHLKTHEKDHPSFLPFPYTFAGTTNHESVRKG